MSAKEGWSTGDQVLQKGGGSGAKDESLKIALVPRMGTRKARRLLPAVSLQAGSPQTIQKRLIIAN